MASNIFKWIKDHPAKKFKGASTHPETNYKPKPVPPEEACDCMPGSKERMAAYRKRLEQDKEVFCESDNNGESAKGARSRAGVAYTIRKSRRSLTIESI